MKNIERWRSVEGVILDILWINSTEGIDISDNTKIIKENLINSGATKE